MRPSAPCFEEKRYVWDGMETPGSDLRVKDEDHRNLVNVLHDAVSYFLLVLQRALSGRILFSSRCRRCFFKNARRAFEGYVVLSS
jgi:hypothetical protein